MARNNRVWRLLAAAACVLVCLPGGSAPTAQPVSGEAGDPATPTSEANTDPAPPEPDVDWVDSNEWRPEEQQDQVEYPEASEWRNKPGVSSSAGEGTTVSKARCVLSGSDDGKDFGSVTLVPATDGVTIECALIGLKPGQDYDLYLQDYASLVTGAQGEGAPLATPFLHSRKRVLIATFAADDEGGVTLTRVAPGLTLDGQDSIVGRSFVLHTHPSALEDPPKSDVHTRIAEGVIGIAESS